MTRTESAYEDWASRPSSGAAAFEHRLGIAVYVAEPGPDGEWLHVSPAIEEILGVLPEDLIADRVLWLSLLHPDDRERLMTSETELEVDTRARSDYRVIRRDGRVVWLLDDAVVARSDDGRAVMDGYLVDVTTQRRAERMLAAQAAVVERLTGSATLAEVIADLPTAGVAATSAVACSIELDGLEPRVALRTDVEAVPADGARTDAEVRGEDGSVRGRVVLTYAPGVEPPAPELEVPTWAAGLVALAQSRIAERERAVTSLALLTATLESTVDGILVVDHDQRIVGHNSRFAALWAVPDDILAAGDDSSLLDYVVEQLEDPAAFIEGVHRLYDHPEATSVDELRFADGRVFERYSQPQWVGGVPVGRVWSFRDVTEKRTLQADLREREASLERLVDQVSDYSIVNLDPEGRVVSWNQGAARIKQYAEAEILGRDLSVFFPEEAPYTGRAAALLKRAVADGRARDEGWCLRRGGERFWATTVLTALRDEAGALRGFGLVMQDTTERHAQQQALERRARTLAVLGTIAAVANSATSVGDALDAALVAVCDHGRWDVAHVYLLDDMTGELRHHVWHVDVELDRAVVADFIAETTAEVPERLALPAEVLAKRRTVWLPELPAPRSSRDLAGRDAGLVSASGVPILVGEESAGVLEFFSTAPHPFDTDAELVMRHLGAQLARVVERERAERHSEALARELIRLEEHLLAQGAHSGNTGDRPHV
ncbi:PAS domain S-box protein [Oryzobacter terrae]|uniref:PAS domain S-box protein n=1 Tax=Oryzobacter terrae TaxID=1620385 RepID=UPI00366AEBF2